MGSCLIGTILASMLVPASVEVPGALRASGLVLAAALALVPLALAVRRPRSLFRAEHIVVLAPVFWLLIDIIQGSYPLLLVDQSDVRTAIWAVGLFAIGAWLAMVARPWEPPRFVSRASRVEFPVRTLFAVAACAFGLGMCRFAIPLNFDLVAMFSWLGQGRWGAPWSRGQLGGWDAFADHLAYFGYILPALTVLIARKTGWASWRTLSTLAMSGVMTLFLADGGGRRIIGVVFGAALVTFVISAERVRMRHFLIVGGAVAALLWLLSFILDYRNVGLRAAFSDQGESVVERSQRDHYHIDDNFLRLSQIIHFIPDTHPYVYTKYAVWVAVRPIPRIFWPGKPIDPGFDLPAILGMQGVSLSCSVIGEFYGSWGLFAVFVGGWFFGRLAGAANRLLAGQITPSGILLYSLALLSLFAGVRSMLDLVLMSYPILAWVGLLWLYRRFAYSPGSSATRQHRPPAEPGWSPRAATTARRAPR